MDILCCDPLDEEDTESDGSITCEEENILECDYDTQCTKLYKLIEDKKWEEVLYYLESGKFYDTSIFTPLFGNEPDPPSFQARTWVTALDETGDVRWCQLPLHAAVTFRAPLLVISRLLDTYPKSVRCADDQDMLPLHYAFRFGSDDDVLALLLENFPQAIGKRAVKDRLPLDMAQYSPKPERGTIIEYYVDHAVRSAKKEWDTQYEKKVKGIHNNETIDTSLKHEVTSKKKPQGTEKQPMEARQEVQGIQGGNWTTANKKEVRDDTVAQQSRRSNYRKAYDSVEDSNTPNLPRVRNDDHPSYDHPAEDKPLKNRLRGLFGKRRKAVHQQ